MTMRISKNRIDLDDKILRKPVLEDYGETLVGGASGTNTGSSYTVDLTNGNVFNLILSANCAFTFSNPPGSGTTGSFTLILTQDGTGSRTATWPSAVLWADGTAPTLTTTPASVDILQFFTYDAGTTWFGFVASQDLYTALAYTDHGDFNPSHTSASTIDITCTTTRETAVLCIYGFANPTGITLDSVVADPSGSNDAFTEMVDGNQDVNGDRSFCMGIWGINQTLSSTTVRATFSSNLTNDTFIATLLSFDNVESLTAEDTDTTNVGSGTSLTLSALNAGSAGGYGLFWAAHSSTNTSFTWSGVTGGTELSDVAQNNTFGRASAFISPISYDGSNAIATWSGAQRGAACAITIR